MNTRTLLSLLLPLALALPLTACKSEGGEPTRSGEQTSAAGAEAKPATGGAEAKAAAKTESTEQADEAEMPGRKTIPAPPDVAAPPADAEKTASGLASKVLQKGSGTEHPTAADTVRVDYTGWTTDGKMFDSSITRGQPAVFPLRGVIAGWTEGLQLMVPGEKRRFWIPEKLAYQGRPGRPQGMLVFDVELHDIVKPPPTPENVAKAPKDAKKTDSGLEYVYLRHGEGKVHPTAQSLVEVHYTGWTTDGKMFDSSVTRGRPAVFPLNRVIPGWTEMVQLMVEGDKVRAWIPAELAYKGNPRAPQGTLVFDIELLSIKR